MGERSQGILPDGCQAEDPMRRQEDRGYTALLKFPPGVADKIHSHPEANQITIGLSGEVKMPTSGVIAPLQPNLTLTMDKGGKHGATLFTKESIGLFFWDGPPKPVVEE